jgi:hypothetical protein
MLSVIMLNVFMLNVVATLRQVKFRMACFKRVSLVTAVNYDHKMFNV